MPLFDKVGKRGGPEPQGPQITPEMQREMGTLRNDPGTYLKSRGFSIPDGMRDPREITVHLLKTGQVGAPKLREIFGIK